MSPVVGWGAVALAAMLWIATVGFWAAAIWTSGKVSERLFGTGFLAVFCALGVTFAAATFLDGRDR